MATIDINVSSQIPNLTRVTLQALISGSDLSTQKWYIITDAVGATKRIGVMATGASTLSNAAVNLTDGTFGSYNISTDVYTASAGGSFVPYTGATTDVDLGLHYLLAQALALNTTTTGTAGVGKMVWNDSYGTIEFKLKGGNVTLQIGQEQVAHVVNKTGGNLLEANYQCIYVSGAQGQRIKAGLAKADSAVTCENTLGLVTETINNNQEGYVTTAGLVNGINTTGSLQGETWADGDVLYLSQSTAGQITNIAPTSGIIVIVGYCVHAHATQGKIFVNIHVTLEQPFIPLAGTAIGKPVTGNVEVIDGVEWFYASATERFSIQAVAGRGWLLTVEDIANSYTTTIDFRSDLISFASANPAFLGAVYGADYSANFQLGSIIDLRTLKSRFWTKAGTPTTSDDSAAGFIVGSLIWDTTNSILYRCTSNTAGAATWTAAINALTDGNKGDVTVASSGTSWTVTRFQGRPFSSAAPTTGQAIIWNGTTWIPTTLTKDLQSYVATPASNVALNLTRFIPFQGSNAPSASAGSYAGVIGKPINTVSAFCNVVISGSTSGVGTATLFKNGAATTLVITIPNGSTSGVYSATGAISFAATDTCYWQIVTPTGTAIQFNNVVLNYQDQ
jgi:hypothetical protein